MDEHEKINWGEIVGSIAAIVIVGAFIWDSSHTNEDQKDIKADNKLDELLVSIDEKVSFCKEMIRQNEILLRPLSPEWRNPIFVNHMHSCRYYRDSYQRYLNGLLFVRARVCERGCISFKEMIEINKRIADLHERSFPGK